MDMFTSDEAFQFIEKNLGVKNARERVNGDRKALLDEIATKLQTELVFNNLRLLSEPPERRRRPTMDEIKADLLSGIGGLCYNLDVSCFFLLKAIGFNTSLIHGTCTSTVVFENNHIAVLAADVEKPGDKFLLEVGFGFPTYRAIDLSFEKESPGYRDSFIEYKYVKHEGKILRMHRKGCPIRSSSSDKTGALNFWLEDWRRFYWLEPSSETKDFRNFDKNFDEVFTNPKASPFHMSFRVIGFPNKKAVMVVNQKTLIENDKGDLQPAEIPGGDEGVIAKVKELFPVLPDTLVKSAFENYRKVAQ